MSFSHKGFFSCVKRKRRITVLFLIAVISLVFLMNHVLLLSTISVSVNNFDDLFVAKTTTPQAQPACVEKRNFVFIKQMKCATSTLLGTWYRFGYKRNLSFVSPLGSRLYLNWPYPLTKLDFRPSSVGYNILTEHSVYTPDVMDAIMPNDTVYLSILRYPLAQVQSLFQYFKVGSIVDIKEKEVFVEYFSHPEKYEEIYKKPGAKGRYCIPDGFSMTKNLMAHCLGMPLGFPPNTPDISGDLDKVKEYIEDIDKKFKLIMIVEYLYESLILLRRMMCWTFNDLIFMNANFGRYTFDNQHVPQHVKDKHKNWTSVDYMLYDHFNKTFWKKVSEQSEDFFDEALAMENLKERVHKYCYSVYPFGQRPYYRFPWGKQFLTIEASNWTSEFKIYPEDCRMLGPDPYNLYRTVQFENDINERDLLQKQAKIVDKRSQNEKSLC